jgi:hypothetical protein
LDLLQHLAWPGDESVLDAAMRSGPWWHLLVETITQERRISMAPSAIDDGSEPPPFQPFRLKTRGAFGVRGDALPRNRLH